MEARVCNNAHPSPNAEALAVCQCLSRYTNYTVSETLYQCYSSTSPLQEYSLLVLYLLMSSSRQSPLSTSSLLQKWAVLSSMLQHLGSSISQHLNLLYRNQDKAKRHSNRNFGTRSRISNYLWASVEKIFMSFIQYFRFYPTPGARSRVKINPKTHDRCANLKNSPCKPGREASC